MIFWWVCTECNGVDGVVVISSDSDDDQQQDDPFLFPGDREQHRQNIIDDDDEVQGVDPPEDLDFAEGRVVQQRFMYGLTPDLRNQQIYKEILQGTYIFHILVIHCILCRLSVCLSVWAQRLNVELYTKRSWIR